jgi:hypothetical protein
LRLLRRRCWGLLLLRQLRLFLLPLLSFLMLRNRLLLLLLLWRRRLLLLLMAGAVGWYCVGPLLLPLRLQRLRWLCIPSAVACCHVAARIDVLLMMLQGVSCQ